ncbi:hypothetical protein EUGRSUZ_G02088 [Eucalyptus grandis]|uniref:Uncharacterized protein n=2 Tax=Eucalyptus grandis TaxID=71139 RepID=A0ACC3K518_EUCGR|nr:hypothetical protein EUGRSUZ_G02088 [Eucalyptus grandis]
MSSSGKEEVAVMESYPMNGGDGTFSYNKNSNFQRVATNVARETINEVIAEKLDIKQFSPALTTFQIADLGCSVGPNTFLAVQNIIEAVRRKYESQGLSSQLPDFQVLFNDHASNDFNTLFASLPSDRPYCAAGVPGSFHGRLFPKASLHFVHSSYALQWLCKGIISEAQVDSFNLPVYAPSPDEMTALVESNGCFSIERMDLAAPGSKIDVSFGGHACMLHLRAGMEGIISKHFGSEIIDDLFDRFLEKTNEFSDRLNSAYRQGSQLVAILKRK